jgi:predicted SAM-dependent methyltransferase
LVCDCSALPYDDGTADLIVLHHVLEHFGCGEGVGVLKEAHRVLAPSGRLLIFVPDMKALAQSWLVGKLNTETYLINVYGAYMGDPADRHKFGFTRETLKDELVKVAPWQRVDLFNWRNIPGAKIAGPDFWILAMEAVK